MRAPGHLYPAQHLIPAIFCFRFEYLKAFRCRFIFKIGLCLISGDIGNAGSQAYGFVLTQFKLEYGTGSRSRTTGASDIEASLS